MDTWGVVLADVDPGVLGAEGADPAPAPAPPNPKNAVGKPAWRYRASRPGGKRPAAAAAAAAAGLDKLLKILKI